MQKHDSGTHVRETWNTRAAFVLAAIGSAVGLGNLWGFPYKLYTYGGGAFLIPYFIAMVVMGVPLLIMEFSVGHWAQQSPPGAFAKVLGKYRYVGWWLVALAFVIITYYAVILAYCVDYLVISVVSLAKPTLPWASSDPGMAEHYFLNGMVRFDGSMSLGMPAGKIVVGMILSWVMIYLCLFRGVKWVSKVVLLTVPLPWIMLVILTVRGLTLEGALHGLEFYLEPRWGKLLEPDTWRFAFGQVFFSMSLGFAVMLSYASFLHRRSDLNNNALIIGLGDMGTSFVAGVAVFSMLGGMAFAAGQATGQPVDIAGLIPGDSTVGLSFIVFPYGLTQLPAAAIFSCVFFLALLTLGIDSAFSIVEACLASVCDSKPTWPRKYVLPAVCIIGAGIGLVFTAGRGGLSWLGLADGLINGPFGILIVALAECLVVGWAWRGEFLVSMREHANERSDWRLHRWWDVVVKIVAPALLAVLIVWSISGQVHDEVDARRAARTAESLEYQALLPEYAPFGAAIDDAATALTLNTAARFQAGEAGDAAALARLEHEQASLSRDLEAAQDRAAGIRAELTALEEAGATPAYGLPWPLIVGSAFFIIVPILCWLLSGGRKETERERRQGVRYGVLFTVIVMVVAAVVIETAHVRGWLEVEETAFEPNGQLDPTAYLFLSIGLVAIFGGLIWCFWKAMQAAGRDDKAMNGPRAWPS